MLIQIMISIVKSFEWQKKSINLLNLPNYVLKIIRLMLVITEDHLLLTPSQSGQLIQPSY